jgi:hypothetical protein
MNILKEKVQFFNRSLVKVPKKLEKLYRFGFWALSGERITSIRGNARQIIANKHTAKTKAWRLLKNRKWAQVIPALLRHLKLVLCHSIVCVDFSDFHGWQILTFAVQTKKGRAIPVYFEIIKYPITKDSQNIFIVSAIEHFVEIIGFRPKLVMDRGFACPHIIKYLARERHPFVVRVKSIKQFRNWQNRLFKAKNTMKKDQHVRGYGRKLRLVISDKLKGVEQPWYLITNDFTSTRNQIVTDYYHRFEIEEFFKDAKWLLGLEWVRFLKLQSITNVFWFVILGIWFLALLPQPHEKDTSDNHHDLSFLRFAFETFQRELRLLAFLSLGLQPL